jgi:hypothetical protein
MLNPGAEGPHIVSIILDAKMPGRIMTGMAKHFLQASIN